MRIHILFFIAPLAVLLSVLLVSPARADIDGFREMQWGTALSEIQRTRKLTLTNENGPNGSTLYSIQDADLRFGGAVLTGIHCSFVQDRLESVILLFQGVKEFAAVRTEAFSQFGETQRYDQDGAELYNWVGELTSIVLSFNRDSQTGIVFLKSKKTREQVKIPESEPYGQETEQETALDRAPPVMMRQEQTPEAITPEIQHLIDRDQELTPLCWATVGPQAEAACDQMRAGVERLKALGMCMTPSEPGRAGPETHWYRCEPQPVAPVDKGKQSLCRLVEELFSATARMRDEGASPQTAEEELLGQWTGRDAQVTTERIRETVELVYFDPDFSSAGGEPLQDRVHESCLNGQGPYARPLK